MALIVPHTSREGIQTANNPGPMARITQGMEKADKDDVASQVANVFDDDDTVLGLLKARYFMPQSARKQVRRLSPPHRRR